MHEESSFFANFIKYFLYIAVGIELIFAIVWLGGNITIFGGDKWSLDYLSAGKSLIVDDYMGILYALFLGLLIKVVGEGTGLFAVLYLLQLLTVFSATFSLPLSKKAKIVGGVLLIANPIVLRTACQIKPNAFSFACLICITGFFARLLIEKNFKYAIGSFAFACALSLLQPDYAWVLLITAACVAVVFLIIRRFKIVTAVLPLLIAGVLGILVSEIVSVPLSYERGEKTAELMLLRRTGWKDGFYSAFIFSEAFDKDKEYIDVFREASKGAEGIESILAYPIEAKYGTDAAQNVYVESAKFLFRKHKGAVCKEAIADALNNMFPWISFPVIYFSQKSGNYIADEVASFTDFLPKLSSVQLFFGLFVGAALSFLGVIAIVKHSSKTRNVCITFATIMAIVIAVSFMFLAPRGLDVSNVLHSFTLFQLCLVGVVCR